VEDGARLVGVMDAGLYAERIRDVVAEDDFEVACIAEFGEVLCASRRGMEGVGSAIEMLMASPARWSCASHISLVLLLFLSSSYLVPTAASRGFDVTLDWPEDEVR